MTAPRTLLHAALAARRSVHRSLVIAIIALGPAAPAVAQHALVLSGGGARGLAHAGAIVALEELGYQPAPIVGASMGAIVGALYAAGYPAADIRAIIRDENWLERFASAPVLFGPMRDPRRPLITFGISSVRSMAARSSARTSTWPRPWPAAVTTRGRWHC
jgi:predicted acylesterase/phospholipase RssA